MSVSEELEHLRHLMSMATCFELNGRSVVKRAGKKWSVKEAGLILNSDGNWEYEPSPSRRSEEFKQRTRFDFETAMKLAREAE